MCMKTIALRLATGTRDVCIACIALPLVAFSLGMAAIYYPIPLLAAAIAGGCLGWVVFFRLMSRADAELHGRIASIFSFGAISMSAAFGSGMMAAGPGNYDVMALAISFVCGLVGAILFRQYQREIKGGPAAADAKA